MPNYSLLFARTPQDADDSACVDWKWEKVGELHQEFRRPDNGERIRYVMDKRGQTLQGLRWNTRVYLGKDWYKRTDAIHISANLVSGFFVMVDPVLIPRGRRKRTRDERIVDAIKQLAELKGEQG